MNNLKFKVEDKNKVFIDEIIQTTFASRIQLDLKIEKEIIEKKDDIEKQLNGVFSQVTYNWKMKVRNGALRGKYFSNLFFFNNPQEADLFFIKNELYEKVGLVPPFNRLEQYFNSFGFDFKLIRKNGILVVQISWEKYFEKEIDLPDEKESLPDEKEVTEEDETI